MEKVKLDLNVNSNVWSCLSSQSLAEKLQQVKATKPHLDKVFVYISYVLC